jgi:hypothetical protein
MHLVEWMENKNENTLTPHDALLTVGLCAALTNVSEGKDYLQRIADLARSHSLFSDEVDTIKQKIELLFPLVHRTGPEAAIDLAARSLTQKLRETAFKWAVIIALSNGSLLEEKKCFSENLSYCF